MKLPQDTVFPTHPYIQDRSIHASYRSDQTTALGSSTVASMSSSTAFTKWMTWVSPQTRGRVFNAMLTRSNHICCFFHIPEQTMRDLRESVQKNAPQDMRFTINDVITAYLTIVVAQAKAKVSAAWWSKPLPSMIRSLVGKDFGKSDSYVAVVYINQRARLSLPNIDKYMGNMAIGKSFPLSWDQVHEDPTDRVLAALAQKINQAITATDEQYVGQFGHLLDREPDNFMRLIACTMDTKNKLMTSNQSRFPHYGVDFGSGIPSMVRHAPHAFSDLAYVMPANPATGGGYEIEFNLAPEVALQVVQNDTWMKLADRYDCYL
ncbi:hypothetical protein EV175_002065 [Coemansia sp. RSA 1933]|nr:hypothetical protein EV175_002065 [Coemansia sp. RSA 1933]